MSAIGRRLRRAWSSREQRERVGDRVRRRARSRRLDRSSERMQPCARRCERERAPRRGARRTGRAASRRPTSSSSGHSIAASALRTARDLFALVERAAADEHVRDAARLERAHVRPRHVAPEALEAPEQQADVARRDRHARSLPRSVTVQPLFVTSQSTNAPTASGNDVLDRRVRDLADSPYGRGTGSAITRRLRRRRRRGTARAGRTSPGRRRASPARTPR